MTLNWNSYIGRCHDELRERPQPQSARAFNTSSWLLPVGGVGCWLGGFRFQWTTWQQHQASVFLSAGRRGWKPRWPSQRGVSSISGFLSQAGFLEAGTPDNGHVGRGFLQQTPMSVKPLAGWLPLQLFSLFFPAPATRTVAVPGVTGRAFAHLAFFLPGARYSHEFYDFHSALTLFSECSWNPTLATSVFPSKHIHAPSSLCCLIFCLVHTLLIYFWWSLLVKDMLHEDKNECLILCSTPVPRKPCNQHSWQHDELCKQNNEGTIALPSFNRKLWANSSTILSLSLAIIKFIWYDNPYLPVLNFQQDYERIHLAW